MSPRYPARDVYRKVPAACACGAKVKPKVHDVVVRDSGGAPLLRIRQRTHWIALLLPTEKVSARLLGIIRQSIAELLQCANPQAADFTNRVSRTRERQEAAAGAARAGGRSAGSQDLP
jgi:hypothetical protein